jgi:hypothetical protein
VTIAPHSGIIDFGVFTPPELGKDGIQGEVPAPLIGEELYVLTATGWAAVGGGSGTVTSVSGTGTVNGITLTGTVTSSGSLTLGGALSGVSLTTQVSGVLPIANGGTNGAATPTAGGVAYGTGTAYAVNSAGTSGQVLTSAGAGAPTWTTPTTGTVTSVGGTGTVNGITLTGTVTSSGSLTLGGTLSGVSLTTQVSGTLPVGNGGTGATTLTGVVIGNGTSAFTTVTAPSGAIVGTTDTQTLTNKRYTPRVSSTASITSPLAWNSDNFDQYAATAQSTAFTISADAGTPTDGQKSIFRILDNGTSRVITFTGGASKAFRPVGVTLTVSGSDFTYTTTANKTVYFGCIYNSAASRWDIIALSLEA